MTVKKKGAIVIAGTHSGVGKTSISIGIMRALTRRGLKVQPFKVGPDFIDPGHHRRSAGRVSRNLDGWMLSREFNVENFRRHLADADIAVIEGVMGLFDGYDGCSESGSTAEMAKWLRARVILVLDAWSLARSAAALIQGYVNFDPDLDVAGVIFNKIAGRSHLDWLKQAVGPSCPVAILGGVPKTKDIEVPERHLGLLMSYEDNLSSDYVEKLADLVEANVDLEKLLSILDFGLRNAEWERVSGAGYQVSDHGRVSRFEADAQNSSPHPPLLSPDTPPSSADTRHPMPDILSQPAIRIGVARDAAFCFYYQDNLDLLIEMGAKLVEFSPLSDSVLPKNLDAIYLGGGYPELYAETLAKNRALLHQVCDFSFGGGVVYGECGGLMYLGQGIEDSSGRRFPLCGVFPFWTRMVSQLKLAYAEIETEPHNVLFPVVQKIRGHIFHFSEIVDQPEIDSTRDATCRVARAYRVKTFADYFQEGFQFKNTLASYAHLHFGSNPEFAASLVRKCHETNRHLR